MFLYVIFLSLSRLLQVLSFLILVEVILSWVYPQGKVFAFLYRLTEPIMRPFRGISRWLILNFHIPVDFSPWLAMIAINLVSRLLWRIYFFL